MFSVKESVRNLINIRIHTPTKCFLIETVRHHVASELLTLWYFENHYNNISFSIVPFDFVASFTVSTYRENDCLSLRSCPKSN